MAATRLCIVRHGETAWNAERRIQGHLDIGLNDTGERQALAAADWLAAVPFAAVYSSDLLRARTTAAPLAAARGIEVRLEPRLRERRYGIFEGLTYDEARRDHPTVYAFLDSRDPGYGFPGGGESLGELHDRVTAALVEILERHAGETVAVVTHGGVLDIINRFVRGRPLDVPRDFTIPNAGITWIGVTDGALHLEVWGDTRHLEAVALDELPR